MFDLIEINGNLMVNTDKNIYDLRDKWVKSLYKGMEKGKKLTLGQEYQFKLLLGEYLAGELSRLSECIEIDEATKLSFNNCSGAVGNYFDRLILLAISCYENDIDPKVGQKALTSIDKALDYTIQLIPNFEYVLKAFSKKYNLIIAENVEHLYAEL